MGLIEVVKETIKIQSDDWKLAGSNVMPDMTLRMRDMLPRSYSEKNERAEEWAQYTCEKAALYAFGIGKCENFERPIPTVEYQGDRFRLRKSGFRQTRIYSSDQVLLFILRNSQDECEHVGVTLGAKGKDYIFHKPGKRPPEISSLEKAYEKYNDGNYRGPLDIEFWKMNGR